MTTYNKFMTTLNSYTRKFPHQRFLQDIFTKDFYEKIKSIKRSWKVGTDCSGIEAPIMSLNLLNIPFTHVFSCEIDEDCRKSIEKNYEPKKLYRDITTRDHKSLGKLDFYVAGFPCQAFSGMRNDAVGFDDPRGTIFFECLQTIKSTKPEFFILENVRGLLTHDKGNTFKVILQSLKKLNSYNIQYKVLNTIDYNIPQNRPRLFIVGINKKYGDHFTFPQPIKKTVNMTDIMEKLDYTDKKNLTANMKTVITNRLKRKNGKRSDNYIINVNASEDGFGSAMLEQSPCLLANAHNFFSTKYMRFLTESGVVKFSCKPFDPTMFLYPYFFKFFIWSSFSGCALNK